MPTPSNLSRLIHRAPQCISDIARAIGPSVGRYSRYIGKQVATSACRCMLCNQNSHGQGLCTACQQGLPTNQHSCSVCDLPLNTAISAQATLEATQDNTPNAIAKHTPNNILCAECLKHPPLFERAVCAYRYDYPADYLVRQFKYHNNHSAGALLTTTLLTRIDQQLNASADIDCLIPVPMPLWRTLKRGHNPAAQVALKVHQHTGITLLPQALKRMQHTHTQQGLSRKERLRNLHNAYQLNRAIPKHSRIAVIDDVMTTGATAHEISRLLLKAGAASVQWWALARTPAKHS